jgi:hypothetical protein
MVIVTGLLHLSAVAGISVIVIGLLPGARSNAARHFLCRSLA